MRCYAKGVSLWEKRKRAVLDFDNASPRKGQKHEINRIFGFFSVKDRNLFHLVNTIGNIFTCGCATRENITDGVHSTRILYTYL